MSDLSAFRAAVSDLMGGDLASQVQALNQMRQVISVRLELFLAATPEVVLELLDELAQVEREPHPVVRSKM